MNKKYIKEFAEFLVGLKDVSLTEKFMQNILTPAELEEISMRLQIFKMLKKGVSQREIAMKLGVSIGTISRGSRELKYGERGISKILETKILV